MSNQILYLGDTALRQAASYLAGVLHFYKIDFDYLASDHPFSPALLDNDYEAFVLSDYPAKNFTQGQLSLMANRVGDGAGLLMIGGWDSFGGIHSEYTNTEMKDVLPVVMQAGDDRINCFQPCLIEKVCGHPIIEGLPFDEACPGIGGYNRLGVKSDAMEILASRQVRVRRGPLGYEFAPSTETEPLLIAGTFGLGRVAAYASDVAPHWVGGLVDWGDNRLTACAEGANVIEVGNWYARFFCQLVKWTAKL